MFDLEIAKELFKIEPHYCLLRNRKENYYGNKKTNYK